MGDSQLVINQLLGEYKCNNPILEEYLEEAKGLLEHFTDVIKSQILKASNEVANDLAQQVFGYKLMVPDINSIKNGIVAIINHQPSPKALETGTNSVFD